MSQQLYKITYCAMDTLNSTLLFFFFSFLEFTENTEALKTKMSELRLYCNLLVQQVHKTKEASISAVSEPEVQLYFWCRPLL